MQQDLKKFQKKQKRDKNNLLLETAEEVENWESI